MLSAKLKTFISVFVFCCFAHSHSSNSVDLGFQFASENTYRDTVGPFMDLTFATRPWLQWRFGAASFLSQKALESLVYRFEIEASPLSWISFNLRGARRSQFYDSFSRTSLLGLMRFHSPSWFGVSFFGSGGFYQRWSFLGNSSLVPFQSASSFSQFDFATDLGFRARVFEALETQLRVSTFDPWDVYNLNNPFIESSWIWEQGERKSQWAAFFRYQLLLGFGRLDRLTFGISHVLAL